MSEQTIPLEREPSREEYMAVRNAAGEPCECTEEMKLVFAETSVCCKPCAARQVLNGITTLADTL
jgi:hypothetical protein